METLRMTRRSTQKAVVLRLAVIALIVLASMGVPGAASAQQLCAEHADVVKQLDARHAEAPVAFGITANGGVIEVFSTGDGSTWTMVLTTPDGTTCMLAAGEAWETLPSLMAGPRA
jgi:hypothetical protein